MSNITNQTLSEIINNIKCKKLSSLEVTKAFIENSKKSNKLNSYITECFDSAIKSAKDFDKKKDYKGLLAASIQSDNPTIFIEHKSHMHKRVSNFILNEEVPEKRYITKIGKAKIVKEGSDLTIVTLSAQVEHSLKVANKLQSNNINIEVISYHFNNIESIVAVSHC